MGRHDIVVARTPLEGREYAKALLRDLDSLEFMVANGVIESGIRRLGAEQELFLVDSGWRPALQATDVLSGLSGKEFTTELGFSTSRSTSIHSCSGPTGFPGYINASMRS